MNNRYTPFGYGIRDGVTVIIPTEADVILKIFSQYLSGESLKNIAATLTAEKVEYLPEKWQWNKNRVVRILNDRRYPGNEKYPSIINEDMFQQAQRIKLARNTQTECDREKVISSSVAPIVCGKCGCVTKRTFDKRRKFPQRYVCDNPQCNAVYRISDDDMIQMIETLIENATLVTENKTNESEISEIRRLEREIDRAIEYYDGKSESIEAVILDCVNRKYQTISKGRADSDKLAIYLQEADFRISRRTVMELVRQIKLISDEEIELTLINGQLVRKE